MNKLTDKQKADLKKHMMKHKDLKDMSVSQLRSHRIRMTTQMRKGLTLNKAHGEIMKKPKY